MKNFLRFQTPVIVWVLLIFWLSSIKSIPSISFPIPLDKVAHSCVFFVLCWFSHRAFYFQNRFQWLKNHALLWAFVFACFYGYSDEFHQRFVPGRTYDLYDWMTDALSALAFVVLFKATARWRKRRGKEIYIS